MSSRLVQSALAVALVSALVPAVSARAAKQQRLVVTPNGKLRIEKTTLKSLGVKAASNGLVCVEFPAPPPLKRPTAPKPRTHDEEHEHEVANAPVRLWLPVAKDGAVTVARTFLGPPSGYVPGAPGTAYVATGAQGKLVLRKLSGARK